MKYLIWLVVLGVVWWVLMARRKRDVPDSAPPRQVPPETMVVCAHCGVHLPQSEALRADNQTYCCEAHRAASVGTGR